VLDFAMNDKCAAGTGRFLQVIAAALGVDVSEAGRSVCRENTLTLNSMCTVFAESEVISLISQGKEKGEIIAGLHQSIARRIASMVQRMGSLNRITFTGGVARNEGSGKAWSSRSVFLCCSRGLSNGWSDRRSAARPGLLQEIIRLLIKPEANKRRRNNGRLSEYVGKPRNGLGKT